MCIVSPPLSPLVAFIPGSPPPGVFNVASAKVHGGNAEVWIETSMPHETHEIQIHQNIRNFRNSNDCHVSWHDADEVQPLLGPSSHDGRCWTEAASMHPCHSRCSLTLKDLRLQTVRMVQVWNRFEPPRKRACVFQINIYIYSIMF